MIVFSKFSLQYLTALDNALCLRYEVLLYFVSFAGDCTDRLSVVVVFVSSVCQQFVFLVNLEDLCLVLFHERICTLSVLCRAGI